MKKIIYIWLIIFMIIHSLSSQEFNINSSPSACTVASGSITISLANPSTPTYPLPYNVTIIDTILGVARFFEMDAASLVIPEQNGGHYNINIELSPLCKFNGFVAVGISSDTIQGNVFTACGNNGSIELNTSPDLQYLWTTGDTTQNLVGLIPGQYTVTITGSLACIQTATFHVLQDTTLKLTDNYTILHGQPCHRRTGGTIDLSNPDFISGGTAPYTFYEIRNNIRYQTLDITAPITALDSIIIEVEEQNGCKTRKTIMMPYGGFPIMSGIDNQPICDPVLNNGEEVTEVIFEGFTSITTISTHWDIAATVNGSGITDIIPTTNTIYINGGPGSYLLTFMDKTNSACDTTYTWTKQSYVNAQPLTYTTNKTNACGNQPGTLQVNMTGGLGEYNIRVNKIEHNIAHPLYPLISGQVMNIAAGSYQIMMRDDCNGNITDTIVIDGAIDVSIAPYMDECFSSGKATHILASASGSFPPFTYSWSTGLNTAMSTLPANTMPTVTVTDALGCTNTKQAEATYYLGSSSKVTITTTPSCPLASSGSATISVQNYANEKVEIFFNDIKLMPPSYLSVVTLTIPNLAPDEEYGVAIKIGNCDGYRQMLKVPSKTLTEVHKNLIKVDDGAYLCEYDVYCEGTKVFENLTHPVQATTEFQTSNVKCNKWKYQCGANSVTENMDSWWAHGIQLEYLRSAVGFDVLFQDNLPINDCAMYKVCEDGKRASGQINLGCLDADLVGDDGASCQQFRCICLFNFLGSPIETFTACSDQTPERYRNYIDLLRSNCREIKKVRGFRIENGSFPGLADLRYQGSTLEAFITDNVGRPEFKCSEMYYCVTDGTFKFIASNINSVQCGPQFFCATCPPLSFPVYNCDLITDIQDNTTFIACGNTFFGPLRTTLESCTNLVQDTSDNVFGSLRNVIDCVNETTIILDYDMDNAPFRIDSLLKISKNINLKGIGSQRPKIVLTDISSKISLENNIIGIENIDIITNSLGDSFINSGHLFLKNVNIIGKNVMPRFENKLDLIVEGDFKLLIQP